MALSFPEKALVVATGLSVLHHVDHTLRFDHSGWPFKPEVTPFTYSLLVYPAIVLVLLLRGRPWLRVGLSFLLALFPTLAHVFLETPFDQYQTWAVLPQVNLLHLASPGLGALAAATTVLLSLAALVSFVGFLNEALRSR